MNENGLNDIKKFGDFQESMGPTYPLDFVSILTTLQHPFSPFLKLNSNEIGKERRECDLGALMIFEAHGVATDQGAQGAKPGAPGTPFGREGHKPQPRMPMLAPGTLETESLPLGAKGAEGQGPSLDVKGVGRFEVGTKGALGWLGHLNSYAKRPYGIDP